MFGVWWQRQLRAKTTKANTMHSTRMQAGCRWNKALLDLAWAVLCFGWLTQ